MDRPQEEPIRPLVQLQVPQQVLVQTNLCPSVAGKRSKRWRSNP
jgi:hypothetical protein